MSEKKVEYFARTPASYFAAIDFPRLFRIDPSDSTTTSNIQNFPLTMPDQQTVADGLDDATLSVGDGRFDKFIEMGVEPRACPRLILTHQSRIAHYVRGEDRSKPPLNAFFGHRERYFPDAR